MIKRYYLFAIVLLCPFTMSVMGQHVDDTIDEDVLSKKDIKQLEKDTVRLYNNIVNVWKYIVEEQKKNGQLDEDYQSLLSEFSKESIFLLKQEIVELEERLNKMPDRIKALRDDIKRINDELKTADSELASMNVYSEIKKHQLYKDNLQYLNQKYSCMSLEKLTDMRNNSNEFSSFDELNDYHKRINNAIKNKMIYDEAWKCVSEGIGYQDVEKYRTKINTLLDVKSDNSAERVYKLLTKQYNEMDSLDIKLSRFNNGIKQLQNVVSRINADKKIMAFRNSPKSEFKDECIAQMKRIIIPTEGSEQKNIYDRYFAMIPYLKELLDMYWSELQKTPFTTPTETEIKITGLVVK